MDRLATYQTTLFAQGEPAMFEGAAFERIELDPYSWLELSRNWLDGADELLARLQAQLSWKGGERPMYGSLVTEPRLHAAPRLGDPATPEIIRAMARSIDDRYDEGIDAVFVNYYRDGHDSVAWHADRVGRHDVDPIVVIVSLGGPRRFHLRPMGGGESVKLVLGSGDLLVMGGACQHAWEHAVPKMASASPRISVTLRHAAHIDDDQWWHAHPPRTD